MTGSPIVRPMFYEFFNDNQTYSLSDQFMVGQSLMVVPVMNQETDGAGTVPVPAYFPAGIW